MAGARLIPTTGWALLALISAGILDASPLVWETLGLTSPAAGVVPDGDRWLARSAAAAGHDLALLIAVLLGQMVVGTILGLAMVGAVGRVLRPIAALLNSASVILLSLAGMSLLVLAGEAQIAAFDVRLLIVGVLILASWPGVALAVCDAAAAERTTPYYRSARELGVSGLVRLSRHVLPAIWRPMAWASCNALIRTMGALFIIGFLKAGPLEGIETLGAVLVASMAEGDPTLPMEVMVPGGMMIALMLPLVMIGEGWRK
ncbi:ABC transporter permease subunit [Rhodobacteraceae bacterium NNCM2]|nr:ABC transporter permease subunit [Coraliihabitans acroporae]